MYDAHILFGFLNNPHPCYEPNSHNVGTFICFLGTPSTHTLWTTGRHMCMLPDDRGQLTVDDIDFSEIKSAKSTFLIERGSMIWRKVIL